MKLAKALPVAGNAIDLHLDDMSLPLLAGMLAGFDTLRGCPGSNCPSGMTARSCPRSGTVCWPRIRDGTVPAWAAGPPAIRQAEALRSAVFVVHRDLAVLFDRVVLVRVPSGGCG